MHVLASARPRGRPWSALRAWRGDRELTLGQSRHGGQDAGLGEGWAQKRAHRGGRARADEVCTRARGGDVLFPIRFGVVSYTIRILMYLDVS